MKVWSFRINNEDQQTSKAEERRVSVVSSSLHQRSHSFQKHSFPFNNSWQTLLEMFYFLLLYTAYFYPRKFHRIGRSFMQGRERKKGEIWYISDTGRGALHSLLHFP